MAQHLVPDRSTEPVAAARSNKHLLLPGANVFKEIVFVRQRAHAIRPSGRLASARVARSRNADR